MSTDRAFVCKARLTSANTSKAYIPNDPKDRGAGSHMAECVQILLTGVKDEIFGPATPNFSLQATIQNPAVAKMLREAYQHDYVEREDNACGVECRITVEVLGPSYPDVY